MRSFVSASKVALILGCWANSFVGAFVTRPAANLRAVSASRLAVLPVDGLDHAVNHAPQALDSALNSASTHLSGIFWKTIAPEDARGQFYFFFGAGTGAGGIGLGQVPQILEELGEIRALGGSGPTEGGPSLKTNPLATFFYPTELCRADVEKVIKSVPSPEAIVARGKSKSYFASKGYVAREDFVDALVEGGPKCNPLATYATFEALSRGGGSVVSPVDVEERLRTYREEGGIEGPFVSDLTGASTTRLAAYTGLAFLLFLVFDLIIESGLNAFFPDL